MADYAVRPIAVNGLTTAINDTVTGTSKPSAISGTTIMISVGIAGALFICFGGHADTVTTANGFLLAAGGTYRFSNPGSTHLHYIQSTVGTTISILSADGGI